MIFSPQKKHFAGIEIYLVNHPEGNSGNLIITILDESNKILNTIKVDLSRVPEADWYKVYTKANLKKDVHYTLRFSAEGCMTVPHLQSINSDYLPAETLSGSILLSYAYSEPTFTFQNKVIISMYIIAIWLFMCGYFMNNGQKRYFQQTSVIIFMISVLTWNYMYNSMDIQNGNFAGFQSDSETLVTGMLQAEHTVENFRSAEGYGLGRYCNLKGALFSYELTYITDDNWLDGYSRTDNKIIVDSNTYSRKVASIGNYIRFENGEIYRIEKVDDDNTNIVIWLDSVKALTPAKNGSLDHAVFFDADQNQLESGKIFAYRSSYGLQGKVFRFLAHYMEKDQLLDNLNLLCCIASAFVFVILTFLVYAKYNRVLAGCFFITFWLSPWVVNFARNLYWVEFTWFLPMIVGLFCAWKIENRMCRIASYVLTLITVMGKCLCGYEYVSTIMMGGISFLVVDLMLSLINRDKQKEILLFKTIIIIGLAALLGFMLAICIHASLKGKGDVIKGIQNIIEQDVLRRTNGADLNNYDSMYWPSFNASIWEVFCMYFHFPTEIITGIAGNMFPIMCIIPLCILIYEYKIKKPDVESAIMYVMFFLTSVSWFYLAKSHSYVHTHMSFVLWYFGFVQICLYIIVNKIIKVCINR